MNEDSTVNQRMYRKTVKKFKLLAAEDKRTVPAQLDVIADRELKKYPKLLDPKHDYIEGK